MTGAFDLTKLAGEDKPHIYINSYNLDTRESDIFSNRPSPKGDQHPNLPITMPALCASSALPYILSPVQLDNGLHMEGALIDSFCFEAIHNRHDDLNEVWVSQIVDHKQVKPPGNLLEALNNLIMLYAGTTSRHDVEIFAHDLNRNEVMHKLLNARHQVDPIELFSLADRGHHQLFLVL